MSNTVELNLTAKDQMSGVVRGAAGAVQGLVGQVTMLAGLGGAGLGLGALVKQGIDFNKTMEDSKGGIAGVLLMTREYVDATGKVVTGQKAMDAAFAESSVIQEKLKKDALSTAASYTELVGAFQTALAPAAAVGVKNLDDVREITVMATQAMAALNIPTAQAAQELRGLFSGDMGPDNRLNQILRVSKDDLKALGGDAEKIAAFFKEKLGPAASAAAMQTGTLTVRLSNLGDIIDQVMGKATSGVFRELSEGVADVIKWVEEIGPAAQTAGDSLLSSFKAAVGPIEEVGRSVFAFLDTRVQESGGTWSEVFQGVAIVFNNVMGHVRAGWVVVVNAILHPLDTIRLVFGNLLGNILSMLAAVAEKFPKFMGGDQWAETLRSAASAVDEWGLKNSKFLAGVEVGLARTEAAWEANEKAIVGAGQATSKLSDTTSRAKSAAEDAAGAAHGFGTVWAAESAKASAALDKFLGGFAAFTGDVVGEATAKIEEEYGDLVGQLGQMMFQAKVPFEKGLAMLEELARAKGGKITAAIFGGEAAVEDFMDVLTAPASKDNVAIGLLDTWHRIKDEVPGAAASASQALRDIWDSAGRAFNDLFYGVVTGRLDDLGDVFRGFVDNMASTFSNLVTAMVQRWIAGTQSIGDGMRALNKSMTSEGGGLSWQGGAMAAGTGYGIGSMIGPGGTGNQVGGAVGALAGAYLGAKLGTMGGPIGMLVGAILGAVIGGIFNKNTEKKFSVYTARLVDVAANDQIGRSIQNSRDNIIGMMGDLAALTGGSVKDATDQTRKVINDWLKGRKYEVHAGSQEDIDKDFERLLGEVVPSEMLKQLFGFSIKPYEPTTELPGIRGVGNFHMGNIDEGKEGPLFRMLETLGFARDRIVEIGQQIDARPAEEFIGWLNRLVGVAATSKMLFAEMGKSFADLDAEWSAKEEAGAKGAFTERATAIADAFAAIENFSGDDQLKRMEEAQQGAAEFWNDVLDYVAQLREAMNQMSAGIQDQRQKMRDFLNPLGADESASNAWGVVPGVWGKLRNATDPAEVEAAVAEARSAIDEVFQVMAERINRGKALLEKLGGLGSISDELTREGIEATDPLRAWGREMADMQRKVEDASRQSGLAQIQTLEEVGASAEEMYRNLKGFLADIASTSASINKSIDSQIWELGVGEMDPQGQAGAITARIKELQDQLALATSPAEIAAITSEIQGLTNRYVGTFGKDDKDRAEAISWAQEQLERARGLAQEQLDILKAQGEAYAKQLEGTITTVTGMLEENIDDASTTIGQLSHTLGELDRVMREAMERLGDEILTTAQPIREALEEATKLFTDSIDAASGAIGGGGSGGGGGGGGRTPLVDAANLGASNLVTFAAELAAATERLRTFGPGGTSTTQQQAPAASTQQAYVSGQPSGRAVAAAVRRYRMATVRQVA